MSEILTQITNKIAQAGGRPLAVGGFVRDRILGLNPKDIDVEVFGLSAETLIGILSSFGKVDTVGVSFGVIKLWTEDQDFDFSLPRRENKAGNGHKGFIVEVDPSMTVEEAASRRDFTFNSMALDLITGHILDPFNGRKDLENRVLRHTSDKFSEDPLRVLRGMQFAGRFGLRPAPKTIRLCETLRPEFRDLSVERVWGEWQKWAEKSIIPNMGLNILWHTGWLSLFPELVNLVGCPQDKEWHPEGDVFVHTEWVVNRMADICERDNVTGTDRVARIFGALCHDLAKAQKTTLKRGRWVSPGHAAAGEEPTRTFLARIGMPVSLRDRVVEMVREHMVHVGFTGSKRQVRRLLSRLKAASIADILAVIEADHSGRPPLPRGMPVNAQAILEMAEEMGNEVKPVLMGRHLIELGIEPGPEMGRLLKIAFEAQLDGAFETAEAGKEWFINELGPEITKTETN